MLDSGAGESVLSSPLRKFLRSLKPCGSCGYKAPLHFKARYLWPYLSDAGLKRWVPNKGFKSFAPQEEAVGFEFSFDYGSWCLGLGLWGDCVPVSYLLPFGPLSFAR